MYLKQFNKEEKGWGENNVYNTVARGLGRDKLFFPLAFFIKEATKNV